MQTVKLFCCYAPEDQPLHEQLVKQLASLERVELIALWSDQEISAGKDWQKEIEEYLNTAGIILLLISPDFIASNYCNSVEKHAVERHEAGAARVIPIILRPVAWQCLSIGKLRALPTGESPITTWKNRDQAFYDVVKGVRKVVEEFSQLSELDQGMGTVPDRYSEIEKRIRHTTDFITEQTREFVGRQFVFDAITRFITTNPCGYFALRGDPGIGKSSLLAQMVKKYSYIHHFNRRTLGIVKTEKFLENICAQIIREYHLNYTSLPPDATQDGAFLGRLLGEVSVKLKADEKALILIDALDEVDTSTLCPGANILYLPEVLPPGVYVVMTTRRTSSAGPIPRRIDCPQETFDIKHDSAGNIADIQKYLTQSVERPGIQEYITTQDSNSEVFIGLLLEKSEGNFMYLHHVLPEIECGAYKNLDMKILPRGLQGYYEDHWERMCNKDDESRFQDKLSVIATLAAAYEPVPIEFIEYITTIPSPRICTILMEWDPFLHSESIKEGDTSQEHYWVYHMSFHDFLAQQKAVRSELNQLNLLQEAHRNITRRFLQKRP